LIVEHGGDRIGYEFKCGTSVSRGDVAGLRTGINDGIIGRGIVVCAGSRRYPMADEIEAIPGESLPDQYSASGALTKKKSEI
jgi:hypothetical protein